MTDTNAPTTFSRDDIRTAFFDGAAPEVVLVPFGKAQIELRTPSLAELATYRQEASAQLNPGEQDPELMAKMVIRNSYVPGTGGATKIFNAADVDVIMSMSFNADMRRLIGSLNKLLSNDDAIEGAVTDATKKVADESATIPDNVAQSEDASA